MLKTKPHIRLIAGKGHHVIRRPYSQAIIYFLVITITLQTGCTTIAPKPKTQYQALMGKVAVVTKAQEPKIKFEGLTRGKAEGAAQGAGGSFVQCLGMLRGGCGGSFCGAVILLWLGVCGVAGVAGGVVGAALAPSAQEVRTTKTALSGTFDARVIQESLRDQVVAAALDHGTTLVVVPSTMEKNAVEKNDYRDFADANVDNVLEIALTEVGLKKDSGTDHTVLPYMKTHIRLINASEDAEVLSADYVYEGSSRKIAEWSANQYARLLQALDAGYENLGTLIYDNVFLLYPFPDRGLHGTSFGLKALYPSSWSTVNDVYPTLHWQEFPRSSDIEVEPEEMGRVKNVRYDLVIAEENNALPGEIIYQRKGLRGNSHMVENALRYGKRYFWTVRAHFELDGRERVTEWGSSNLPTPEQVTTPSKWSFQFKTQERPRSKP